MQHKNTVFVTLIVEDKTLIEENKDQYNLNSDIFYPKIDISAFDDRDKLPRAIANAMNIWMDTAKDKKRVPCVNLQEKSIWVDRSAFHYKKSCRIVVLVELEMRDNFNTIPINYSDNYTLQNLQASGRNKKHSTKPSSPPA